MMSTRPIRPELLEEARRWLDEGLGAYVPARYLAALGSARREREFSQHNYRRRARRQSRGGRAA